MKKNVLQCTGKGQSLIEFALILPLLLIFTVFILDFGRGIYYFSSLYNASREGARYAVTNIYIDQGLTPAIQSAIASHARQYLYGLPPSLPVTSLITDGSTEAIKYITVGVSYCFVPVTPFVSQLFGGSCLPLASNSTMRVEPILNPNP